MLFMKTHSLKKENLIIEKSSDEAAIDFNKVTCDLFKFRSVTAFQVFQLFLFLKYNVN